MMVIKSKMMRWAGHIARKGEMRSIYKILVGKPEGKGPCGRHTCRWEDNIKIDLREKGLEGMDWIRLAQEGTRGRFLWTQ